MEIVKKINFQLIVNFLNADIIKATYTALGINYLAQKQKAKLASVEIHKTNKIQSCINCKPILLFVCCTAYKLEHVLAIHIMFSNKKK